MDLLLCKKCNKRSEYDDDGSPRVLEDTKILEKKSGFVSIQDRVASLAEHEKNADRFKRRPVLDTADNIRPARQYATLQELFSSKSNLPSPYSTGSSDADDAKSQHSTCKRPKIPIMKLTKDDWNVKCWEDRLLLHKRRQQQQQQQFIGKSLASGEHQRLPEKKIEVFQGRIEDVAKKLDKVREGTPLDEQLYQLALNKNREVKSSHEWTDMLKRELEKGTHNSKQLRSEFAKSDTKSPLGRPIRKIFQQEENDEIEN